MLQNKQKMSYYIPKWMNFKAAVKKGLVLPGNFLGKLESMRLLTKEEASRWEEYQLGFD